MKIAPERFASRRDTLAFVICVVLALSVRVAPPQVQEPISNTIQNIMVPALWLEQQVKLTVEARSLVGSLMARRDSTVIDSLQLFMLSEENARLRDLLLLSSRMPIRHVAAEVLQQSSPMAGFTLLLSKGTEDGVSVMAPVVSSRGLVGIVRSVSATSSVAVTWAHPDFRASAMTADGTVFGIAEPRGRDGPRTALIEIRGVPFRENVAVGAKVYTSGRGSHLGGAFPRGIPIGTVQSLAEQSLGWSKTYVVSPAVQPGAVSHVIVLVGVTDDVAVAFEPRSP